jgi:hypothetical protein
MSLCAIGVSSLGAATAWGAGTEAQVPRERVFSFRFGAPGKGEGQFSHPTGVAVNDSSGEVYVADRENDRVEQFTPVLGAEGEPTGEKYAGQFTVPFPGQIAVDNCTIKCAEDPSTGDVYVAGAKNAKAEPTEDDVLFKYTPAGVEIGAAHKFKQAIDGVAVDPQGAVFVYEEGGGIGIFGNAELNLEVKKPEATVQIGTKGGAQPGLAVDTSGHLYVGASVNSEEATHDKGLSELLAEAGTEYENLHSSPEARVAELEGGTGAVLIPDMDYEESTAVAVGPAEAVGGSVGPEEDAFVANVGTVAGVPVSSVAVFGPHSEPPETGGNVEERHGDLLQRINAPGLIGADAVAVDGGGTIYAVGGTSDTVDVFDLESRGRPSVGDLSEEASCGQKAPEEPELCSPAATETILKAQVNSAGVDTHYDFEYAAGPGTCKASPSSCTTAPVPPADAGEEFGGSEVSAELTDLPSGIYHYRVTATAAGEVVHSAEKIFTIVASTSGLPDGRAWEMVSPAKKGGYEPEALTREGGTIQAAANGEAITYVSDGPIPAGSHPEGNRNPEPTQVLSFRGAAGWESQDIVTPNETGAGVSPGHPREYQFFSTNLALSLVDPFYSVPSSLARPPLAPPVPGETREENGEQETTSYLRDDAPLRPERSADETEQDFDETQENYEKAKENGAKKGNAGFLALVTEANQPAPGFGEDLNEEGIVPVAATPDLSHAVFQSKRAASGLYEWGGPERNTKLQLVSQLPEGTRVPSEFAGLGGAAGQHGLSSDARHAISSDGSLVFWTYKQGSAFHLYVRDTELQKTLEIDKLQPGEEPPELAKSEPPDAVFQTASADGKKVYFTDTQRLTANSKAVAGSPDLYVFELEIEDGVLSGKIVDLTPEEGADVLVQAHVAGGVLAASEEGKDGAYIYFVANGALTSEAARGQCNGEKEWKAPAGSICNLYVRHFNPESQQWEAPKLVAVLSSEDNPDWGGASAEGDLKLMTSRVSPDGEYLAFMSDRSLTGYDNEDVNSKRPGEHMDEEVYLYDAGDGQLVCASCNPTGARPRGVLDLGQDNTGGSGEGLGLVVDRGETWAVSRSPLDTEDNWLAGSIPGWTAIEESRGIYQSRYLSNSGRLFFNSADALVPLATPTKEEGIGGGQKLTVGVENVYEYEPGGEGGCGSEGGCVALISSGTSPHESAFLDASESGNDVFFLTAAKLAPQDEDTNFDVYDASVCGASCPTAPPAAQEQCEGEGCEKTFTAEQAFAGPATSTSTGSGNLGQVSVLGKKEEKPATTVKPLTRAQKLAKALKACKRDKHKAKRLVCEKQARKKYGPSKSSTKKKSKGKS